MLGELEEQKRRFREKFGREPGPDDPVFFDPDAAEPKQIDPDRFDREVTRALAQAGIDPAFIYAYRRTGLIVTTQNYPLLSERDRQEWEEALAEYHGKLKGKPS